MCLNMWPVGCFLYQLPPILLLLPLIKHAGARHLPKSFAICSYNSAVGHVGTIVCVQMGNWGLDGLKQLPTL